MAGIRREDEITLIEDIIAGLEAALYETGSDLGENSDDEFRNARDIRVNKLVHKPIEEFGLPILWSWFRYGQSIPRKKVMGWNVTSGPLDERANEPYQAHVEIVQSAKSPADYRDYYVEEVDIDHVCDLGLDEFLEEVYDGAPEDYRELYLANLDIQRILDEMYTSSEWTQSISKFYDEMYESTLTFQKVVLSDSIFGEELSSNASKYVRLLRNAVKSFDESTEISDNQVSVINSLAKVYHEHVWRSIALQISSESAEGPSRNYWSEKWGDEAKEEAEDTKQVLNDLERELIDGGLTVKPHEYDEFPDDDLTTALREIESRILI